MFKKSQIVSKFLAAYGWGILMVVIAIAALIYLGVLNPSRFLPESCTIVDGLNCDEFRLDSETNAATIIVKDNLGKSLSDISLSLEGNDCIGQTAIAAGLSASFECPTGLNISSSGQRFKGVLKITYIAEEETLSHTRTGTLIGRFE